MKLRRSLYVTIFTWFWVTLLVGTALVLASTFFVGDQPLGRRWMRLTQDLYAHSAVDFYTTQGAPGLQHYSIRCGVRRACRLCCWMMRCSRSRAARCLRMLSMFCATHNGLEVPCSRCAGSGRRQHPWFRTGQRYTFVIEVEPFGTFWDGTFLIPTLYRLITAAAVAALFCLVLTRHIVSPLRSLQTVSGRIAAGDLEARVGPEIGNRADEFGEVARTFDGMADRIALLLRRRQEMLAEISHELRSPLTRWSVSLELLRLGENDVLPQMEADLERMNSMIGQILTLTRLELQPNSLSQHPVDLHLLLQSIASDAAFEAQADGKGVELDAGPCHVRGDANLLRSCIENMVRNAVHYTAAGTTVQITLRDTTNACEVQVTDHGPGVPAEMLPSLFEPFFRGSDARETHESTSGTGLGLAIARRIAEAHAGSIAAENRACGGLAVTLRLPRAVST